MKNGCDSTQDADVVEEENDRGSETTPGKELVLIRSRTERNVSRYMVGSYGSERCETVVVN